MTKYVLALTREARNRGNPTINDLVERVRGITGAEIIGDIDSQTRIVQIQYGGSLAELSKGLGLPKKDYIIESSLSEYRDDVNYNGIGTFPNISPNKR